MMTLITIICLVLFIPVLFVRVWPEEAAVILTGIGIVIFGFTYPVGFGITMVVALLIITVCIFYTAWTVKRGRNTRGHSRLWKLRGPLSE